jgi:hypothetical protein
MPTLRERVVSLIAASPGLTDRELTDQLLGPTEGQQAVNQVARSLATSGAIRRAQRADGKIGNYIEVPAGKSLAVAPKDAGAMNPLSEDEVKRAIETWLIGSGWKVNVKWGRATGIDIEAVKGAERWIIEAKGCGSLAQMRVNYFVGMLGELLQRMSDRSAKYSLALPDMTQFRSLWGRLPDLAKERTTISALFVSSSGRIDEA